MITISDPKDKQTYETTGQAENMVLCRHFGEDIIRELVSDLDP